MAMGNTGRSWRQQGDATTAEPTVTADSSAGADRLRTKYAMPGGVTARVGALAFAAGLGLTMVAGSGVAAASPSDTGAPDTSTQSADAAPGHDGQGAADDDSTSTALSGSPADSGDRDDDGPDPEALSAGLDADEDISTATHRKPAARRDRAAIPEVAEDDGSPGRDAEPDLPVGVPEDSSPGGGVRPAVAPALSRLGLATPPAAPVLPRLAATAWAPPQLSTAAVALMPQAVPAARSPLFGEGDSNHPAPVGLLAAMAWVRREIEQSAIAAAFTGPARQISPESLDPSGWFRDTFTAPSPTIVTSSVAVEGVPNQATRPTELDGDAGRVSGLTYDLDGSATATGVAGGTLTIDGDTATYTPPSSWAGTTAYTDRFTVTATEAERGFHLHGLPGLVNLLTFGLLGDAGHSTTATLNLQVVPVSHPVDVPADNAVTIKDQWGTANLNGYLVMNNGWNLTNGYNPDHTTNQQWLTVGGPDNVFTIVKENSYLPAPGQQVGSPLSYPSVVLGCTYNHCSQDYTTHIAQLDDIASLPTSIDFSYSHPESSRFDASYDIWLDRSATPPTNQPNEMEVMVWFARNGVQPVGNVVVPSYTIAGREFEVWQGVNNGGHTQVVTYIAKTPMDSWDFDVTTFTDDVIAHRNVGLTKDWYLVSLQAGYEPWQNVEGFGIESFSATVTRHGDEHADPALDGVADAM